MKFSHIIFSFLLFAGTSLTSSCEDEKKTEDKTDFVVDSAFAAQQKVDSMLGDRSTDTIKNVALPPVEEGDIIFQNVDSDRGKLMKAATDCKYNNVGLIFLRPRDNIYMVAEVGDSTHAIPLTDWVNKGIGKHVAIVRMKDAKIIFNEKKLKKLKAEVLKFKKLPYDPYFGWGDDAMYPSELVYKLYHNSLGLMLCATRKFSELHYADPIAKRAFYEKYNSNFPLEEVIVTPDDLYHSPVCTIVYER